MKLGIHALNHHKIGSENIRDLVEWLLGEGHQIWVSAAIVKSIEKAGFSTQHFPQFQLGDSIPYLDCLLSLGGDGTILDTILYAVPSGVPILGINFGRLGFLAAAHASTYKSVIQSLQAGNLPIQERSLVESGFTTLNPFQEQNFALNEISITKRDSASMITVKTFLNGELLNDYWGDGIIVSTPTGSTGYALSCGGPILLPDSNGLVITPISPHNLSMRPLVIPDGATIDLVPTGRQSKIMISMDSRSKSFTVNEKITISVSRKVARFVRVPGHSFLQTLREKLFWGKDIRN